MLRASSRRRSSAPAARRRNRCRQCCACCCRAPRSRGPRPQTRSRWRSATRTTGRAFDISREDAEARRIKKSHTKTQRCRLGSHIASSPMVVSFLPDFVRPSKSEGRDKNAPAAAKTALFVSLCENILLFLLCAFAPLRETLFPSLFPFHSRHA